MKPRRKLLSKTPAFRFVVNGGLASVERLVGGRYMPLYATSPAQAAQEVHELNNEPDSPLHDVYLLLDL